jgi:prepilin signal peptidase PulO-like enzyme (type II secretory pathway)
MIIAVLLVFGLCLGSFVNALVWRLHEQEEVKGKKPKVKHEGLSILKGRSMCPHCRHELAAKDLIPVLSWLSLKGRCRYCHKAISWQYPLVELLGALLFVFSYLYWPFVSVAGVWNGQAVTLFVFWLIFLVGFMALVVYDLKWFLLPDKIVYPLLSLAVLQVLLLITVFHGGMPAFREAFFGFAVGGGIFYLLFQVSDGKWIGGGDVKLGALLGLILGAPAESFLVLFLASLLGTLASLPLLVTGKANRRTRLPFGPFLIVACIIVYLFGSSLIGWYKRQFLFY